MMTGKMTRKEAIARIKDHMSVHKIYEGRAVKITEALGMAISALEQPEIIRCKDCKHWREGNAFSYCDKLHEMGVLDALDYMTAEDDYCSMAERREE